MDVEFRLENIDETLTDDPSLKEIRESAAVTATLCTMLVSKLGEIAKEYNRKHEEKISSIALTDALFSTLIATINELLEMDEQDQNQVADFVYLTWKTVIKQQCYSRSTVLVPFASYYCMKSNSSTTVN